MKLSVIIPVYNEKSTILEIIKRVQNVPIQKEIIVVDDGSNDGTREILQQSFPESLSFEGRMNKIRPKALIHPLPSCILHPKEKEDTPISIKIILKEKNEGKGAAIREGLKYISGDVIVIQDADLEYDPMDWIKMLKIMEKEKADVVYGSRVLGKGEKSSLAFYLGGRLLSSLTNFLYGAYITDEPTCYKIFRKDVIKGINLKCKGFEFCPEVTAKLLKKGYKIYEVPISYKPRKIKEGKKIRWKDGVIAIWTLIKYRFVK